MSQAWLSCWNHASGHSGCVDLDLEFESAKRHCKVAQAWPAAAANVLKPYGHLCSPVNIRTASRWPLRRVPA